MRLRTRALILLALAVALVTALAVSAGAETKGYYTYEISGGEATITDCSQSISGAVTIPSNLGGYPVTSIGDRAFEYCTALTSVTIGDSVTSIGSNAFDYCTALTSVTIGNSVTSIGYGAFYDTGYYNNNWENDVLYIGKYLIQAKTTLSGSYTIKDGARCIADYAFYECTALTSVTIPDSVTSIGDRAFYGCTALTSVTIGNGVTSIGEWAFFYCNKLKSITIPDSVTSIGSSAFYYCTALTSVTIGSGVTSIGESAFYDCESLTGVYITDLAAWCKIDFNGYTPNPPYYLPYSSNPLSYAHKLYLNGTLVTDLVIPDSVTSIGDYAFYYYNALTSVTIGSGVTSIGNYAFYGSFSLERVTITDSVTSIGDYAFYCCTALTSVMLPNSVTCIGSGAFSECTSLTDVHYAGSPAQRNEMGIGSDNSYLTGATWYRGYESAASGKCGDNLSYIYDTATKRLNISGNGAMWDYNNTLHPGWYAYKDELTSVTIGDSVTSIGSSAFSGCTALTSVTIGDSVTSIGSSAFSGCTALTSVTIGDSVTSIGYRAFYGCTALTSVTIGDSVTSIGGSAFYGCVTLMSVHITDLAAWCEIDFIVDYFSDCSRCSNPLYYAHNLYLNNTLVTDLVIPSGVTSIGNYAFNGCDSLTSVTIPDSVTSIGNYAFSNCYSLTSVHITDLAAWCKIVFRNSDSNPLGFAHNLYLNNTLVTDLVIPSGVTSIGNYAFNGCDSLTSVTIPDSVTSIGYAAFNHCYSLTSVHITDLAAWCKIVFRDSDSNPLGFAYNLYLNNTLVTDLVIPSGVTSIGDYAFYYCTALTSVSIPDSVMSIGAYAFDDCTGLTDAYYDGTEVQWNAIALSSYGNDLLRNATKHFTDHVHTFSNLWTSDTDYHWHAATCTHTDEVSDKAAHTWNSGVVTTKPTTTQEGKKTFTCTVCGETKTEMIAKQVVPYTITSLTVCDASGKTLSDLPQSDFLAAAAIKRTGSDTTATVVIAAYNGEGQMKKCAYIQFDDVPLGATVKATMPITNDGTIACVKAFVIGAIGNWTPLSEVAVIE